MPDTLLYETSKETAEGYAVPLRALPTTPWLGLIVGVGKIVQTNWTARSNCSATHSK